MSIDMDYIHLSPAMLRNIVKTYQRTCVHNSQDIPNFQSRDFNCYFVHFKRRTFNNANPDARMPHNKKNQIRHMESWEVAKCSL